MLQTLTPKQLTLTFNAKDLGFSDTSQLVGKNIGWIGQAQAEQAARFGLNINHPGFHLLVLGDSGSGRTSLMLEAIHEAAAQRPSAPDLVCLHNFDVPEKPLNLRMQTGAGAELRSTLEQLTRQLAKTIPALASSQLQSVVNDFLDQELSALKAQFIARVLDSRKFGQYVDALKRDVLENLEVFQQGPNTDEGVLEAFLSRYRANLLVDNRDLAGDRPGAPVIYDEDPTFHSLFGGMESASDNGNSTADFLRLHAGNLLRADGGVLVLHLRDIQAEQHSGSQILEKLHRFLRNNRIQIEESASGSGHGGAVYLTPEAIPVQVKVVLIATRDEYYQLHEESIDLAEFFRITVDFSESFAANLENYQAVAAYIASRCCYFQLKHFTAAAVAKLTMEMHRWLEDKAKLSTNFGELQGLILESDAMAALRKAELVDTQDVIAAIKAQQQRHQYPEQQLSDSIAEGELMIRVQGRETGQINGLGHVDMGDVGFGSPLRISARCFAGNQGVVHIDREIKMSGPNHDKGLFIIKSWLSASFARLAPLSLSASLVLEQEYHGVEGDSASCAELYALLSALSGLPLPQGIAVTGALNQHGEVMPVGGINEKIEGYFRICKRVGLDGNQGILIPERNKRHLVLDEEVVSAVEQGLFRIHTMSHVLDGIEHLTGMTAGMPDEEGTYRAETVMGRIQRTLELFRKACDSNSVHAREN